MTRRGPGKWQQKRRHRHDIEQGHFNGHDRIRTKHGKEDHNAGDGQAESRYHDGQGQEQAGSPFLFFYEHDEFPLLFVERVQILSKKGCPMKPQNGLMRQSFTGSRPIAGGSSHRQWLRFPAGAVRAGPGRHGSQQLKCPTAAKPYPGPGRRTFGCPWAG